MALLKNRGLPESVSIVVGMEHQLADEKSSEAMLEAWRLHETPAMARFRGALGNVVRIRRVCLHLALNDADSGSIGA